MARTRSRISSEVVNGAKVFPESPGRVRFLSGPEADALVTHSPAHLRPPHRRAEEGNPDPAPQRIDLDRRVLYFNQTNTKSGKQREVPIDDILHAVLKARLKVRSIGADGDYLFHRRGRRLNNIRTAFDAARNGAGLGSDVGFHTLRHTFASWFMINGGDLYRLQRYLGHSTITSLPHGGRGAVLRGADRTGTGRRARRLPNRHR